MAVDVDGVSLTLEQLVRVARHGEPVTLAPQARERMAGSRALVERILARGDAVYGLTTGVGVRKRVRHSPDAIAAFNRRLIADHRVAQGPAVSADVVRATLLRLLNGFASGTPGVRAELADVLVDALNTGRLPTVRLLGSPGQADLAPLADLADGVLDGFALEAKEGLALLNSNAFATALAALALADAERLLDALTTVAALELEAFAANVDLLHPAVARVRASPGLGSQLGRLRALLAGSYLWQPEAARNLQDPLTFRTLPQVQGAARDALGYAQSQMALELNASQDNPLLVPEEERAVSVGNFEALPLAAALDFVRIGLAPVLTSLHERSIKLLQAPQSGLTDGLQPYGVQHENALSEYAWAGQALAPEAKLLAQPVSVEIASSSQAEGIEDRVSLAPLSARRLAEMVELGERLATLALVIAGQAVELRGASPLGAGTAPALALLRERVAFVGPGDVLASDLEPVRDLIRSGALGTREP